MEFFNQNSLERVYVHTIFMKVIPTTFDNLVIKYTIVQQPKPNASNINKCGFHSFWIDTNAVMLTLCRRKAQFLYKKVEKYKM